MVNNSLFYNLSMPSQKRNRTEFLGVMGFMLSVLGVLLIAISMVWSKIIVLDNVFINIFSLGIITSLAGIFSVIVYLLTRN